MQRPCSAQLRVSTKPRTAVNPTRGAALEDEQCATPSRVNGPGGALALWLAKELTKFSAELDELPGERVPVCVIVTATYRP